MFLAFFFTLQEKVYFKGLRGRREPTDCLGSGNKSQRPWELSREKGQLWGEDTRGEDSMRERRGELPEENVLW